MTMRLWQAGRAGALAVLLAAGLSACANDPVYSMCTARDGDGHLYQATDMDAVAADQKALSDCAFAASDPVTCISAGCRGVH